ncbi:MAG: ABC transporter permease [Salinarimonadaceae bacterium]|nr:MAG: ABC transporter permease [Salinarimonadaceae bacterium]
MSPMRRKLLRDLLRLWPQALAIALVMAAGVATFVLAVGAHASLEQTRSAYYERQRFADVFARVVRAPDSLGPEIAAIPGVAAVETRIAALALLDLPDMIEPASAMMLSLPDHGEALLNVPVLRQGRAPTPGSDREAMVSEPFAAAHGYGLGSTFEAILDGRKRELAIVGIALSPEFVYTVGPGDLMPDDRRFGIVWMSRRALAGAFDLRGAFSEVSVRLRRGASEPAVIDRLDALLEPFGGEGAYGRDDQASHAFLDAELMQLRAMSRILPPIFLLVSALLVNMTLARLVTLEREQIGLLKALGYSGFAIGSHYVEFAGLIALVGVAIGALAGTWLGIGLTTLYGDFFRFPFLLFQKDPQTYLAAAAVTLVAAGVGAARAAAQVAALAPAVAMVPPAPARYKTGLFDRAVALAQLSTTAVMAARSLVRRPLRTAGAVVGAALSVAILVGSLWTFGSVEFMIDVTFNRAERQDATVTFVRERPVAAAREIGRLPGVIAFEPYRAIPVKLRNGTRERRVAIMGVVEGAELSRVLDERLAPIDPPENGLAVSAALARALDLRRGEMVEVELLGGRRHTQVMPVSEVIEGYLGLTANMRLEAANALMGEGALVSGAHILLDPAHDEAFFAAVKDIPAARFVALQRVALQKFRDTLASNIIIMISVYVALAVIIAFGVIYNFARISLSEQGRELASLRVLGFTPAETSGILFVEIGVVTALAQPLGWALGYGFAAMLAQGFESELYRVPLIVGPEVYAWASLVAIGATLVSALVVRRRIDRLDLIAVLKTRE